MAFVWICFRWTPQPEARRQRETVTGRQWITKYRKQRQENEKLGGKRKRKKVSIKWRREQGGVGPMYRYTWQGDYSLECGSGHVLYLPALVLCPLWCVLRSSHIHNKEQSLTNLSQYNFSLHHQCTQLIKNNPPQSWILSLATGCNPNSSSLAACLSLSLSHTHNMS